MLNNFRTFAGLAIGLVFLIALSLIGCAGSSPEVNQEVAVTSSHDTETAADSFLIADTTQEFRAIMEQLMLADVEDMFASMAPIGPDDLEEMLKQFRHGGLSLKSTTDSLQKLIALDSIVSSESLVLDSLAEIANNAFLGVMYSLQKRQVAGDTTLAHIMPADVLELYAKAARFSGLSKCQLTPGRYLEEKNFKKLAEEATRILIASGKDHVDLEMYVFVVRVTALVADKIIIELCPHCAST